MIMNCSYEFYECVVDDHECVVHYEKIYAGLRLNLSKRLARRRSFNSRDINWTISLSKIHVRGICVDEYGFIIALV